MEIFDKVLGISLASGCALLLFLACYGLWSLNQPVPPCQTLIGFHVRGDKLVNVYGPCGHDGCEHTYINARGEDTGECG
jgi:hypothetical protein